MPRVKKRFAESPTEESENESTSSEVGLPPPPVNDANLLSISEMQNSNFAELIKQVQCSQIEQKDAKNSVLPKFNPDRAGSDALSWCSTVDYNLSQNLLVGSALVMAVSKSLEGTASHWLSQTCFLAATVMNLLNARPNEGECLSLYGSRMVTSLMARWKSLNAEQIAVSVTLAHAAGIDKRLCRLVFTTDIKTRNELHQELKAFSFDARQSQHSSDNLSAPQGKRVRTTFF